MVRLKVLLPPDRIAVLKGRKKDEVIREMVALLAESHLIHDEEALYKAVMEREGMLSTGIGLGIAVPHAKVPSVDNVVAALGVTRYPIPYDSIDDEPVRIVVMIAAAPSQQDDYIRALAAVTLFLKNADVREKIINAGAKEEIAALIEQSA